MISEFPGSIHENRIIGKSIRHLPVVDSTNSQLKAEVEAGLFGEGSVLVADYQTTGRGRFDRQWVSPPGKALLFSIILKPCIDPGEQQLVSLLVALAVTGGLDEHFGKHEHDSRGNEIPYRDEICLRLKWPNDILCDGKKMCGILCETGHSKSGERYIIAGIGLNVNQSESDFDAGLKGNVTSLYVETERIQQRGKLLGLILRQLEVYYDRLQETGTRWIAPAWLDRAGIQGDILTVIEQSRTISGECVGLNREGALMVRKHDGEIITVYSGDIS